MTGGDEELTGTPEDLKELQENILRRIEGLSEVSAQHPQAEEFADRIEKWFKVLKEIEAKLNEYEKKK